MIEVRGPKSDTIHYVRGGHDRMGFPWLYQNTLCRRQAPNLGWYRPDRFPEWQRGPLCQKCDNFSKVKS